MVSQRRRYEMSHRELKMPRPSKMMRKLKGKGVELRMLQMRAPETGYCGSLIKDVMTDDTDNGL